MSCFVEDKPFVSLYCERMISSSPSGSVGRLLLVYDASSFGQDLPFDRSQTNNMSFVQDTATILATPAATTSASAMQSVNSTAITTAQNSLLSSPRELLTLPLRGLRQAESLAFSTIPRQLSRLVGLPDMATRISGHAPGTGSAADAAVAATQAVAGAAGERMADAATQMETGVYLAEFLQAMRRFSGFFSYLTSRWSLACFAVVRDKHMVTDLSILTYFKGYNFESYHDLCFDQTTSHSRLSPTHGAANHSHCTVHLSDPRLTSCYTVSNIS